MSWTEQKVSILKELWGKGKTASQIAEIIGGISRNELLAVQIKFISVIKTRRLQQ